MKKWILYIMAFLFVTACVTEGTIDIDPPQPPGGGEDDPGTVTLQIVFPRMDRGTFGTRAITPDEENKIDSLDIFVFQNEASSSKHHSTTDQYLYRVSVPKDSIRVGSNDTTYIVRVTLKTMPPKGQRLVCVANIPEGLNLSLDSVGGAYTPSTVETLLNQLKFSGSPWHETPVSGNYPRIPMWGQMNDTLTFTPGGSLPKIPVIHMIRSVAKIEVGVDVYGTGDPALGFGDIFKLDSIYVCNVSASGYIAPHKDDINAKNTIVSKINPYPDPNDRVVVGYKFTEFPAGSRKMANTIYVPETDTLLTPSSTLKPAFLVIKARYYDGNGSNPYNTYYYRVDFTRGNKYEPLLRNHNYLVNILGVRMSGYGTLDEAMKAPLTTTNYAVVIGGESPTISPEIMDIVVYNNEYMLGVNTSEVMFDWTGDWLGKLSTDATYDYKLMLYTDYANGWRATASSVGSWLTVSSSSGGKTSSSVANLGIMAEPNTSGEERTGEITLTAGMLTKKITVRQSGGANSVIIKATKQKLRIPLAFAAKARAALGLSSTIPPGATASVAWNNNINGFSPLITSLPSGEINTSAVLTLLSTQFGNALVVLTNGNDTLWSWHVWVVNDEEINLNYHNLNTTPVFMDRLLGGSVDGSNSATPGQPYYQWGRKDPFLRNQYGKQITPTLLSPDSIIIEAVRHPRTFYVSSAEHHFNWGRTYYNNNLWYGVGDGTKTYNDPCPAGWRVPYYQETLTPWQNETDINKFRNTGSISAATGDPISSTEGCLWTGFAASWSAYYAEISASGVLNPSKFDAQGNRGAGYAIRCVKDISRKY